MSYIDGCWDGDGQKPYRSPSFRYMISPSLDTGNREIVLSLLNTEGENTSRELRMPFVKGTVISHVSSFVRNKSICFFFMQNKEKESQGDIHVTVTLSKESVKDDQCSNFLYFDISVFTPDEEPTFVGSLKIPEDTGVIYPSTQFHWRAS